MIRLTRRYRFSAAHVLAREDWSAARNAAVYGKCANPAGHGHNYGIELRLEGELDPTSGRLLALEPLDRLVRERLLAELDGAFLNRDLAYFAKVVPTAENLARYVWDNLAGAVDPARLVAVRLVETSKNSVEYAGPEDV